jgi:hypothetical protein
MVDEPRSVLRLAMQLHGPASHAWSSGLSSCIVSDSTTATGGVNSIKDSTACHDNTVRARAREPERVAPPKPGSVANDLRKVRGESRTLTATHVVP